MEDEVEVIKWEAEVMGMLIRCRVKRTLLCRYS
jgi:hypothetical protein